MKKQSMVLDIVKGVGAGLALFAFSFGISFITGSVFAPVTDGSAAGDIIVVNHAGDYYANITSAGEVNIPIVATPDSAQAVGVDELSISTNSTNGYKLYISTRDHSSDSPALPSGTPSNALIDDDSGEYLAPTAGTTAAPAYLGVNEWGYVPGRTNNSETATVYTAADAAPSGSATGQQIWRAVPEYGSAASRAAFYTNTSPSTSGSNTVKVYYGVNANTAMPSGSYANTVVYTAIVEAPGGSTGASLSPASQNYLNAGAEIKIATNLYPGATIDNIGDITVLVGGENCTNVTPSLTTGTYSLNITCNVPAKAAYGTYPVVVNIPKYGMTYSNLTYSYIDPTPQFFKITTMQEMTHDICSESTLPTPNSTNWSTIITKDGAGGTTAWYSGVQGTPQTTLTDTRDNKQYTIRKLPDGKCWMTKNLRYAPTSATTLSNSTDAGQKSDIGSGVSFTMPALGTANGGYSDYNGDEVIEVGTVDTGYKTPSNDYNYGAYYDATYYSWHTATAGTGTSSLTSGFATSSICPRNWRLPTGGTGANNQAGGRANWVNNVYGFNAALLGYFDGAGAYYSGSRGYWWSSSVYNGDYAYYLGLNTSVMYPQNYDYKGHSFALRCVAR